MKIQYDAGHMTKMAAHAMPIYEGCPLSLLTFLITLQFFNILKPNVGDI